MKQLTRFTLPILLLLASASAFSQSMTYDFTGSVYASTGLYSSAQSGDLVTGTVTFDFGASDALVSTGIPGQPGFNATALGGTSLGYYGPAGAVFSMTATVDGLTYSSAPPSSTNYLYQSFIANTAGHFLDAVEFQQPIFSNAFTESELQLASTFGEPFNSLGFPISFSANPGTDDTAAFFSVVGGTQSDVAFTITSLNPVSIVTAVPEPSTYVMMVAGLLMLGGAAFCTRWLGIRQMHEKLGFA